MIRALVLAIGCLLVLPAQSAQLAAAISQSSVEIASSFEGETLTLYGSISAEPGEQERLEPYDVIIVVTGPGETQTVREKGSFLGIWGNAGAQTFEDVPGLIRVLSSRRLDKIAPDDLLDQLHVYPEAYVAQDSHDAQRLRFGRELVRIRTEQALFGIDETGVQFLSDTFYAARLRIPSNARPGPYVAQTYVFQNGAVVSRKTDGFSVRKVGFERYLAQSAVNAPLFYGLACVALALASGLIGGFVFKR